MPSVVKKEQYTIQDGEGHDICHVQGGRVSMFSSNSMSGGWTAKQCKQVIAALQLFVDTEEATAQNAASSEDVPF